MTIKPFRQRRYYTLYEHAAEYVLCSSDCESMTIGDLLNLEEGAAEKFYDQRLGYTETKGNCCLRIDIADMYTSVTSEDVLVCSGAQEPIYLFNQTILKQGDEVIIQFPCYQPIQSIPESLHCKVIQWNVKYEGTTPVYDLKELEKLITKKTKVIYLNSPHNPTGHHFSGMEQSAIISLARKNNCLIFSDEVYRGLEHKPEYILPAMADLYEQGISLGVMSKAYGLPGLRIGWLATKNSEILEKVTLLKEYTSICNSAPGEFLAGVALRNRERILTAHLKIFETNIPVLNSFFDSYDGLFSWHQPIAGSIGFVKMNFKQDGFEFAGRVVQEKNVLLLPGELFDFKGYFRVGFGRKNMPQALKRFEEFICENEVSGDLCTY